MHSIRVLDLYSLKQSPDSDLHGALRIVSLDDDPSFSSLSYTWQGEGSAIQTSNSKIICSNGTIEITQNCSNALIRLREIFGSLTIWVDSVCIDQSDEEEKRSQIPLMREIYGKARRVFIWLGEGNENSDLAMDWLSETSRGLSPWLGVRFHQFPGNMKPSEILKLICLLPEFAAASKFNLSGKESCIEALIRKPRYQSDDAAERHFAVQARSHERYMEPPMVQTHVDNSRTRNGKRTLGNLRQQDHPLE